MEVGREEVGFVQSERRERAFANFRLTWRSSPSEGRRHSVYLNDRSLPEGYLDSVRRAASDLYPTGPPFDGLNALIIPQKRSSSSIYALPATSFRV